MPWTQARSLYEITQKGIALYAAGIAAIAPLEQHIANLLTPTERDIVTDLLSRLHQASTGDPDDEDPPEQPAAY